MQLAELLKLYVAERDIEPVSLKPLRAAIKSLSRNLGTIAAVDHLDKTPVNSWLADEVSRVQRRTAKNYRASILTLWRWAFEEGITDVAPRRIRLVKAPLPPVEAYTTDEIERLLTACDTLTNRFCRNGSPPVPRKLLYRALIMVAWHTGFRSNDLMLLRWSSIAEDGCVRIVQHKTRREAIRWIDKDAMGAIEAIRIDGTPSVFGQFTCQETWRSVFAGLKKVAGVKRGTPKWIRRTTATVTAKKHGRDAAGRALGHVGPEMAQKCYIDQSQIDDPAALKMPRLRRPKRKKR